MLLIALKNYKNKQEEFKKMYGKDYHCYHVENVINVFNKVVEQRIVEVSKKERINNKFNIYKRRWYFYWD